jgi:hypothetical protein
LASLPAHYTLQGMLSAEDIQKPRLSQVWIDFPQPRDAYFYEGYF